MRKKNKDRAHRIDPAMKGYIESYRSRGESYAYVDDSIVHDLLADLQHWCEREKISFEDNLKLAKDSYEAEKRGE